MGLTATSSRRGSAMSIMVILSTVLTGLVLALASIATVHADMAGQIPKVDCAFYAAEAGAQQAIWKFKHDNQWRASADSPFTGSITMYGSTWNYSVTCTDQIGTASLAWKFDEGAGTTTADSSSHGNIGIFHGGVTWDSPGRSGSCIRLGGVDGYVDCGNSSTTNLTGDMSFSAWVKMNSGYYDQKIGGNQNGSYGGYKLCIYNSKVEFEVRDSTNQYYLNRGVAGGTILTMGSWYHVMGVYSEAGHWIKTYVDGKLDRTLTGLPNNALATTTGSFVMGKEPWDSLYYFDGWMDDVRIWNRALSDTDAKTLYDTTVDIRASASGGAVSNFATMSASIPTPPPPTIPAITCGDDFTVQGLNVTGDIQCRGKIDGASPATTVNGNILYGKKYTPASYITLVSPGTSTKAASASAVPFPTIDYTNLHTQATSWGLVVNGDSTGQTYDFTNLGGNKVIWIKGNLTNPTVTIGGLFAAGGTFIVDGTITFSSTATIGSSGYPVYFVANNQNISHTSGTLTLIGGIYTEKNFAHKNCTITGPVWAKQQINNSATATCTFNASSIPWFDNRVLPQSSASLPLYTTAHAGIGP